MVARAERVVEADVLVIGGAAAGLVAAIEARARGASVIVATKGKAGRSGNTVVAGTQFAAVVPYPGSEDSPERHFRDSLAGGKGVNDETLLRILADWGGSRLLKLEEWGVPLLRSGGELVRRTPPGHSCPRGVPVDCAAFPMGVGGLSISLPLRATAERAGTRFLEDTPVVRLVLVDGEVRGALAANLPGTELLLIQARSVVVAAGGAGQIFSNTNNTRGICGDSYGLMLQAGAVLRDMEFVQYYPCQMTSPFRMAVATAMTADGAVLRNRHGERFMPLYDPANQDRATRDVMSRAIFHEIRKGHGVEGEIYMDCTAVPEPILQTRYSVLTRGLRRVGIDPARQWIRMGLATHFFMGGVVVDGRCRTGVPGLFAAGEAVGGVHGANRLSGNALTETAVFGTIAGEAAAEYAGGRCAAPGLPASAAALETGGAGEESLDAVRSELRRAMWDGAGIVRSEESLHSALTTVRECAAAAERCPVPSVALAARREETRLMCLTAESVVLSALARQESRGAHFRQDFPATEDRWLGNHRLRLAGERPQVEFRPAREVEP